MRTKTITNDRVMDAKDVRINKWEGTETTSCLHVEAVV